MSGESNLQTLLRGMKPELQPGVFVFCTLLPGEEIPPAIRPMQIFHEKEGTAFIARQEEAEKADVDFQFVSRMITLTVHSDLNTVGFLAAITTCLAKAGISVNPVSAFYHDHLFVPQERAEEAMKLLHELAHV